MYFPKGFDFGKGIVKFGSDILTFLNGNRTIIQDKEGACNYVFSSKVLEYNENYKKYNWSFTLDEYIPDTL